MPQKPKYLLKRVGKIENIHVVDKNKIVIGRDKSKCDLHCDSVFVSREHAEIHVLQEDVLCISDKGSSNGTYINGEVLPQGKKIPLYLKDIIGFGVVNYEENNENNYHLYEVIEYAEDVCERLKYNIGNERSSLQVSSNCTNNNNNNRIVRNTRSKLSATANEGEIITDSKDLRVEEINTRQIMSSVEMNDEMINQCMMNLDIEFEKLMQKTAKEKLNTVPLAEEKSNKNSATSSIVKLNEINCWNGGYKGTNELNSGEPNATKNDNRSDLGDLVSLSSVRSTTAMISEKMNETDSSKTSLKSDQLGQSECAAGNPSYLKLPLPEENNIEKCENVTLNTVVSRKQRRKQATCEKTQNLKSDSNVDVSETSNSKEKKAETPKKEVLPPSTNARNSTRQKRKCDVLLTNGEISKAKRHKVEEKTSVTCKNDDIECIIIDDDDTNYSPPEQNHTSKPIEDGISIVSYSSKSDNSNQRVAYSKKKRDVAQIGDVNNHEGINEDGEGFVEDAVFAEFNNLIEPSKETCISSQCNQDISNFNDSDEEELYCSQIFNCSDDIDKDEKCNEIIKEEICDDDDVIIIDDEDKDDDIEMQSWYEKLSQSMIDDEDDDKVESKSAASFKDRSAINEKELLDFGEMERKVRDAEPLIAQHEEADIGSRERPSKPTKDKKVILTDALPLPPRRKESTKTTTKDKVANQKQSASSKSKKDKSKTSKEVTNSIKESRKEKLKNIALKNAEKKGCVDKCQTKTVTCVGKITSKTRNDLFVAALVRQTNNDPPKRSLRSNYKIPLIKPNKSNDTKIDVDVDVTLPVPDKITLPVPNNIDQDSRKASNENGSQRNNKNVSRNLRRATMLLENIDISSVLPKQPETVKQTKVRFAEAPTVHYIDLLPGSKLHPVKKDAPLPKIEINNETNSIIQSAPDYSIDETLYSVLRWKVSWLEEYRNKPLPPNVSNNRNFPHTILNVKEKYNSFRDYFCVYQELLLHEAWHQIKDEFFNKARKTEPFSLKVDSFSLKKVERSVASLVTPKNFLVIRCQKLIKEEDIRQKHHPKASEYGILTVKVFSSAKNKYHTLYNFCFIDSIEITRFNPQELYGDKLGTNRLSMTVLIKQFEEDQTIDQNTEIQLKVISNIRPILRQFSALSSLVKFQLNPLFLNPSNHDFSIPELPVEVKTHSFMGKLNSSQQEAVTQCTKLCLGSKPNIALIHGPPGTGKSHVIIQLIAQIYQTSQQKANRLKERPKILVCAPSNLAVDLLVERLLDLREELKANKKRLSIVRVGQRVCETRSRVSCVALEKLAESRLREEYCEEIPVELSLIQAKINSYMMTLNNRSSFKRANHNDTKTKLDELMKKKRELETITQEEYNKRRYTFDRQQMRVSEVKIIRGVDVICTTLNSSMSDSIQKAFMAQEELNPKLTCCIIDEASQCNEPEMLIPFQLNIAKFVLVGDHKQLPATVISDFSKSKGLGNSLFYRICSWWETYGKLSKGAWSPIFSLNVQYRMHQSIANWPCKYFYKNQLKTVYTPITNYPIASYMAIHHSFSEDSHNKESNEREAELVIEMVITILNSCNKIHVGIITPYRQQRALIAEKLMHRFDMRTKERVTINTIDGYQGTEQDVIIMSCVRSSGIGFMCDEQRLNVAVTRARHSLFIVANFDNFKVNHHWASLIDNAKERRRYYVFKEGRLKDLISKITLK